MTTHDFTREKVGKILRGLRAHLTRRLACTYAGVSYETFLSWIDGQFPSGLTESQEAMKASFAKDVDEAEAASLATLCRRAGLES